MTQKIKSVSEAYSCQPNSYRVCTIEMDYPGVFAEAQGALPKPHIHKKDCVVRIDFVSPNECDLFVGYNSDNEMLFRWIADACNVEYFTEEDNQ